MNIRSLKYYLNSIIILIFVVGSLNSAAEEKVNKQSNQESTAKKSKIQETVLGMNVSGNKEAPNLLYIIPWKSSTLNSKPPEINRLMDEVYSTVDPDVYDKELGFYQELTKANAIKSKNLDIE